ncbi:hypothetical protein OAO87_01595 [bacterium]|nr:hypothetical protein [bacterium]
MEPLRPRNTHTNATADHERTALCARRPARTRASDVHPTRTRHTRTLRVRAHTANSRARPLTSSRATAASTHIDRHTSTHINFCSLSLSRSPPLARGCPAVPVVPSGVGGVQPEGDVCLSAVRAVLDEGSFADQGILTEVLHGVSDDVRAPRGSLLCAPHTGALREMAQAASKLATLVSEGWAEEHVSLPYWPLRCDPYSIVDESARAGKPKFRLTNDHSWPPPGAVAGDGTLMGAWGSHVPSLNESMERDRWPAARMVRVREVAEAAAVLGASGAPVRVSVLDCRAYYKRFGRQLGELWRNGAVSEAGYVVDGRCCFGSAADAAKCTRFSNVLVYEMRRELRAVDAAHPPRDARVLSWLAARRAAGEVAGASADEISERWACLHAASMYIDDESTVSIDDDVYDVAGAPVVRGGVQLTRSWLHFDAVKRVLVRFGHESEPSKEQSPRLACELLGVTLDLPSGRMRLAARKRESYASAVRAVAGLRVCPRADYESLMGKLTFASLCYPMGRQWLHAPWRAARAAFRTTRGDVVVSKAVRESLLRWATELEDPAHAGVPLASAGAMPRADAPHAAAVYADAARDCAHAGFGAWAVADGELLYVHGRWSDAERALLICDLELAASTFGLVALQPELRQRHVYSFTDNTVAMAAMRSLTPSTAAMQQLTAARAAWMAERGVAEAAERVTSAANLWADMLSRGDVAGVLQQAARLGLRARRVDVPADWRAMLGAAAEGAGACRAEHAHAGPPLRPHASPRAVPPAGAEAAAVRAAAAAAPPERAALRQRFLDAATVDGTGGLRTTGVRWWLKYCVLSRGELPFTRLTAASPLEAKVEAEQLLMDFALWLALCRPSGRPISARTIKKY